MKDKYKVRESQLIKLNTGEARSIFIVDKLKKFLFWNYYENSGYGNREWNAFENTGKIFGQDNFRYFTSKVLAEECIANLLSTPPLNN